MKIERINDNQIRCTLTGQDLAERHLQLSELAYGSDNAKQLFQEMIQQASYELGFEADDLPLMIEAVPLSGGSLMLNVTKVEYPEELDTRFSNFTPSHDSFGQIEHTSPEHALPESADGILDLFRKLGAAAAALHPSDDDTTDATASLDSDTFVPLKESASTVTDTAPVSSENPLEVSADIVKLFSFRNMEHIVRLARVLKDFYTGDNSLFLDAPEHVYYLVLHKSEHTPSEFNRVCNILSEYALQNRYVASAEAYFSEHFRCIIAQNALQTLAELS